MVHQLTCLQLLSRTPQETSEEAPDMGYSLDDKDIDTAAAG